MADPSQNARWYEEPNDKAHTCLSAVFATIYTESAWRVDADEYHAGLYSASDRPGVRGISRRGYEYGPATLPYNVCRSATDTLTSKISKHRPLPQVLTSRGSWKNQRRAKKMTQFIEGEFYRQRFFTKWWKLLIRDALIFGRGVLKIWTEGPKIKTERTHPWELFIDEWDGRYDDPRNLYHVRSVDKGVLLQRYARTESGGWRKTIKDAIETAGRFELNGQRMQEDQSSTVDRVDVVEAWHLPSAPDAKDGRHVVCVQGATLIDEGWDFDYFPYLVLTYNAALSGPWGHGLVEQIEGYQYCINEASEKSAEQHRMSGIGILVPDNAQIHDQEIRNGITILRHKPGGVPSVFDMDLVNEHTRQRPRELTQDALNDVGMSQMSVQSEKPAGVTAAVALQTLDDIETERFMTFGRDTEEVAVEAGRRYIDCGKQIALEYGDHAVSVPMRGGLIDLKWDDVFVDGVELQVSPTSQLVQELPERLQRLTDLFNTGEIDGTTFLRQLYSADLQAEIDLITSDRLVIDEILEKMLDADEDEGEAAYIPPSAYQQIWVEVPTGIDIGWAPKRAQQKYNRALLDGAAEFNLEMLQRYLKDCQTLIDRERARRAPPPPPMPAAGPPGAMGAPPAPPNAIPPPLPDIGVPGGGGMGVAA